MHRQLRMNHSDVSKHRQHCRAHRCKTEQQRHPLGHIVLLLQGNQHQRRREHMGREVNCRVLAQAIKQVAELQILRGRALDLAVNVSIAQLRHARFTDQVRDLLQSTGFSADRLTIEIAETALNDDMHAAIDTLAELAGLGIRIAIDDFGTGYGGLSWLKSLPVHEIKIDRSFIKGCAIDAVDAAIVSGLVDLAHNLGIQVVAEGVERADQIAFLTQIQCDSIQGYFLGTPMSAEQLGRSIASGRQGRGAACECYSSKTIR